MRAIVIFVLIVTALYSEEAPDIALSNLKKSIPTESTQIHDRIDWLWRCSVRCDQTRRYAEAEAYMAGVLAIVPDNGHALGSMSCYIGKQGRYQEALDIANRAMTAKAKNQVQLLGIKATWLAHLGKSDESAKIWGTLPVPDKINGDDYAMYWICRAFYIARIENDEAALKEAVKNVLSVESDKTHWIGFFMNDVSFAKYQSLDWYRALMTP